MAEVDHEGIVLKRDAMPCALDKIIVDYTLHEEIHCLLSSLRASDHRLALVVHRQDS